MPQAWHALRFRPEIVCGVEVLASSFDFLVHVGVEKSATINACELRYKTLLLASNVFAGLLRLSVRCLSTKVRVPRHVPIVPSKSLLIPA